MIVYIEGVDGSGKTTLKNKIIKQLNKAKNFKKVKVLDNDELRIGTIPNSPGRMTRDTLISRMTEMIKDPNIIYVCDRGPLSDIVYRTFDRDHSPVINLRDLVILGSSYGLINILCDTNKSLELMKKRGDENQIAHLYHHEIRYLYKQLLGLSNYLHYDLEYDNDPDSIAVIETIIAHVWSHHESMLRTKT